MGLNVRPGSAPAGSASLAEVDPATPPGIGDVWAWMAPALIHGVQAFAPFEDGFVFTEYTANYGAYTPSSGICSYYQFPDRLGSNARWMVPFGGGWLLSGPRNTSSAIVNFLRVLPAPAP